MTFAVNIHGATVLRSQRKIMTVDRLKLQCGDRLAVVGRSGSGKSTFIKMLAGLMPFEGPAICVENQKNFAQEIAFSGQIDGRRLRAAGLQIAYVPQQLGLWFNMSVGENIALPAQRLLGYSKMQATDECKGLLTKLGLASKLNDRPSQLSGGEQQRVAIARAAICKPDIVLLDEITSALDPSTTAEILGLLPEMFDKKSAIVFVTHQFGFARQFANHVLFFENGVGAEKLSVNEAIDKAANEGLKKLILDSKRFYSW